MVSTPLQPAGACFPLEAKSRSLGDPVIYFAVSVPGAEQLTVPCSLPSPSPCPGDGFFPLGTKGVAQPRSSRCCLRVAAARPAAGEGQEEEVGVLRGLQKLCRFVCWGWGRGPELWGCAVLIPSVSSWVLRTWPGSQPHPSLPRDPLRDAWGGMPTSWVMGTWRFPAHSRSWAGWGRGWGGFCGLQVAPEQAGVTLRHGMCFGEQGFRRCHFFQHREHSSPAFPSPLNSTRQPSRC